MGCCMSTNTTSPPPKTPHISNSDKHNGGSKSPPPTYPLLDEETVKEVLSETTTIIPKHLSPPIPRFHEISEKKLHQNGVVFNKQPLTVSGSDELSEVDSEICSTHSESVSVSTALTEKSNVGFHETQRSSPSRFKNRSFSGEVKRENMVGKSPGRSSELSPSRIRHGPGYGKKRDSGESSGRRSRSPVIRSDSGSSKTGLGASKSSRKTERSPGRVGSGSGERMQKVEKERDNEEITWPPTSNELLENPLVSLECFIFL